MKLAIWTVTRGAGIRGKKVKEKLGGDLFTLKKFFIDESIPMDNFTETLNENFNKYEGHIFIMATGIVIRKISTLIKSKDVDPAVVVIDENLNFAISLLSGHLGGANELAKVAGEKLNLLPIITTSSDVTGKIAVDTLGQKLNGELESLEKAKNVTALIVDGKEVFLSLPKNINLNGKGEGGIIVSNREKIETVRIYPKNLIVGLGARKNIEKEKVLKAIDLAFEKNNLSKKSIKKFATVDVKENEFGIIEALKDLGFQGMDIISRAEILPIENKFEGSEFVKKQIGVSSVSEPCAFLSSNKNGKFLEKKFKYEGVTVSIYEEN